jgi:hypothetical protein
VEASYGKYLHSRAWVVKRRERLALDDYRCRTCGVSTGPLEVHHVTYERLGDENVETDLITLCRGCHLAITESLKRRRYGSAEPIESEKITTEVSIREATYGMANCEVHVEVILSDARPQRAHGEPSGQIRQDDEGGFREAHQDRRRL